MKKPYYVHFENAPPNFESVLLSEDPDASVFPCMPGSYRVLSKLSFSSLRHLLDVCYQNEHHVLIRIAQADEYLPG